MRRLSAFAATIATSVALAACSSVGGPQASSSVTAADTGNVQGIQGNPFFHASTLPYQAPPFDKIQNSDFKPAILAGMARELAAVQRIANNPAPPTFENTYVALERTGALLNRVMHVFKLITSANTNPTLQQLKAEMAPKLAAHRDAIYLNNKLFERLQAVYDKRESLQLDTESRRLIEVVYHDFVHHGAKLAAADQAKLKQLNQKEARLSAQFINKLLAATKASALIVDDKTKLDGLSATQLAAAKRRAEARGLSGKWLIPLENTTRQPILRDLNNRAVRKRLFMLSWNRAEHGGNNDTRHTILALAAVRAKKAQLLGYPNYAAWKLTTQMAKTPANVKQFLGQLAPAAVAKAKSEARAIQDLIDSTQQAKGEPTFELKPWDWAYYANKIRKAKYDFDASAVKPYFEIWNVLENGVFYAAHQLYGVTFKQRHDIPVYHDGVRVYEVFNADGSSLGLFYCDYFTRPNKNGGAWMNNLVTQSTLLDQKPVIYNVANFPKPAPGQPALLTWNQVITMFHEFGHALHGFFAEQTYPTLSGTQVARDFVEFPSQLNEYWASNPQVFQHYAKHYKTGEPMPQTLVHKMRNAGLFNAGYNMLELVEAAMLDMDWHTLSVNEIPSNVDRFEHQSLVQDGVYLSYVPPRYRSSYFLHIWGHGYSAGYYAYLWTEMLADNAHQWFLNHGGLTRENGMRFRRMVLSQGNTEDLATMYRDWLGHEPKIGPMLKFRGLK